MGELELLKKIRDETKERGAEEEAAILTQTIEDMENSSGKLIDISPMVTGSIDCPECGEKGEKCPHEVVIGARPFGGSLSFAEYDDYESARDTEFHVKEISSVFRMIVDNIFADEGLTLAQKGSAVLSAARELSTRVTQTPTGTRSFLEKIKNLFKGAFTLKTGISTHSPAKLETGSWDGAASRNELRRWASSDGSGDPDKINWNKFRRGFAAFNPPGDKLGDFWGPHHRIRDGNLVTQRSGVIAAFGAAKGARAGTGRPDALPHLNAHRRQFGIGQAEMEALLEVSFKELGLPDDESLGTFVSYKDAQGEWRWMIINTNKFEDREGEIFSEKSHKEYIRYVEKTGEWPELWLWHTPGTRLGEASLVDYVDGFVIHSGQYDSGLEDVAERLSKMGPKLGVSHGYEYILGDEEDKVYDHYRTFELTLCPAERAANIWGTGFESFTKEVSMGFSPEKRKFFVQALGEERVATLETRLPALGEELKVEGVNFKDLVEDLMPEVEAEGTPVVETEAEAEAEAKPAEAPSLEDRVGAIETQVGDIGKSIEQMVAANKALGEGIGDQIAQGLDDALTGRRSAPTNGGKRPTEAEGTEVTEEEAGEAGAKIAGEEGEGAAKYAAPYVQDLTERGVPQG